MAGEYALAVCCLLSVIGVTLIIYKWFKDWLLNPEEWNDYLRARSPILFVITIASMYFVLAFERGSSVIIFGLRIRLWNSKIEHGFSMVSITFMILLHMLRCWKLLVSRMVSTRVSGLNWKSLLDPSLNDSNNFSQTFWIRWKSQVESDEISMNVFLVSFAIMCGLFAVLAIYFSANVLLLGSLALIMPLTFICLLICILTPKGSKFELKKELTYSSITICSTVTLQLVALTSSRMPEQSTWNVLVRQFIWQMGWLVLCLINIYYIPWRHCKNEVNHPFFASPIECCSCILMNEFYNNHRALKSHSNSTADDNTANNHSNNKKHSSERSISTVSRKNTKRMVSSKQLNPLLKECLLSADTLSGFMNHACECFSAENLLMLIEVYLYKRYLRKKIRKLVKRISKRKSFSHSSHSVSLGSALSGGSNGSAGVPAAISINMIYPQPVPQDSDEPSGTRSRSHSASMPDIVDIALVSRHTMSALDDEDDNDYLNCDTTQLVKVFNDSKKLNDGLFRRALEHEWYETAIKQTGWIGKRHSRWDLSLKLPLDELGVRSAIVSDHEKNAYQKAYAIYAKYIANGSSLQVNIGGFTRQTQTSIFQSTIDDDETGFDIPAFLPQLGLCDLLFVFDEVMMDVFVNLEDTCVRYKAQMSR